MLYLGEEDIRSAGFVWPELAAVIKNSLQLLKQQDFAQPLKPYLRYRDLSNRYIAMPAFLGGSINTAGLKWISSFPKNIQDNLPRAHSVVVLNQADNGKPFCIINTALLSAIRTAAVSMTVLQKYLENHAKPEYKIALLGYGMIGKMHAEMISGCFQNSVATLHVFDPALKPGSGTETRMLMADSWQQAYTEADIVLACTVADKPYIDQTAKKGSLHLNVSLRDYKTCFFENSDLCIIVDSWQEVCRENTDIHTANAAGLVYQDDCLLMQDFVLDQKIRASADQILHFNPMGMAVFDIAIAEYFYRRAVSLGYGITLPD